MCFVKAPKASAASQKIAAYDNSEAVEAGAIEARLRRRRAGAAANVLTSATGIPSGQAGTSNQLGGAA